MIHMQEADKEFLDILPTVEALALRLQKTTLNEISYGKGELNIRVARHSIGEVRSFSSPPAPPVEDDAPAPLPSGASILSPRVGFFKSAAKGEQKALVQIGDLVAEGQVVGIVESVNLESNIEATVSGRIRSILLDDGMPVEYGQPLFVVDTEDQ
ncbi:MAG: biotin/lipoyl-binding protein [Armatimonadetes bacterium]|nr:biotin/lipoyl-binding protein [Armatimonadota bacterium]